MKVREEPTVEPTRTYWKTPAVTDSSRNVWNHRGLRAGGICANCRES